MNRPITNKLAWLSVPLTAMALSGSVSIADDHEPHAEILHWWATEGEAAALQVFIDAFKSRGGVYYDSSKVNEVANRQEAIERMGKGYPASLTQWNAGNDLQELYDYGLVKSIEDQEIVKKLKTTLPSPVLDAVSYKGKVIAMPLNVHSENWLWHSYKHTEQSKINLSGDWAEFFELGGELAQKDIPLLAVGNQSWQVRILFSSVFLGVSRDKYKDFYVNVSDDVIDSDEFRETLSVFNKLATYSTSFGDGNWNTQVKAVAEDRAAGVFMGDWAKGEFRTHGLQAGQDYGCRLTSTTDPSLLIVIDALVLGKLEEHSAQEGQNLMLDVVSNAKVSLDFNALKGSVSPYAKPQTSDMDACSKQVYSALENDEVILPPYHSYFPDSDNYAELVDTIIYEFWNASLQSNDKPAELIEETLEKFRILLANKKDLLARGEVIRDIR